MSVVIFDLDGTLVDSAAAIRDVANGLMRELGLAPLDLPETRSYIGHGAPAFLRQALEARAADAATSFAARLARFQEIYAAAPGGANPAFPEVDSTLRALAAAGHRLALCTNKPARPTQSVIDAHGWQDLFHTIVNGDTLPTRKPDPAVLRAAARGAGAGAAVYVGDSEVDAATAEAAGFPFLLYTEGFRNAAIAMPRSTAAFSHFSVLPALVVRHAREVDLGAV